MCGICGAVQIGGAARPPLASDVLDRMTDAMTHRGPNDRGTHLAPGIALGVRRLSIVDVHGGHQPFGNEDGTVWAVQNGELYNHDEIRASLIRDGHRFASRCDTEILPHLYERNGEQLVERLRGKFGLAVWDERRRRAVVARDRLGVKPIYYARAADLVLFASELKSLLASGLVDTELDYDAIDAYLTLGFFPAPRTPLARVSKLLAGERLVVADGDVRIERYWDYPEPRPDERLTADEHAEALVEALDEAVRLRLMSDVPLGAMLSGGLDSSLIVALMANRMDSPVKTFSVGFVESGAANELPQARRVASLFGTDHHELELSIAQENVTLSDLVWHLDEPLADLSSLGFLALSRLAADTVTVALSGQGADELFGGYSRHRNASFARLAGRAARPIGTLLGHGPQRFRSGAAVLAARDPVELYLAANANVDTQLRRRLVTGPLTRLDGREAHRAIADRAPASTADPLATLLHLDGQLGLVDDMLHYFDRASMARSLEVRVPFLDHGLVELSARIPTSLKVRGRTTKYLLKRVARRFLPDDVVHRPKVGFFNAVVGDWFRAQAAGATAQYLRPDTARVYQFLDRREVQRLVGRNDGQTAAHSEQASLLSVLMLELWLTEFLPRATAAPRTAPAPAPARTAS
jgi:asparagine synthase (glutamine-hydrolysing)